MNRSRHAYLGRAAGACWAPLSRRAAEAYRSGSDVSDALDACRRLGAAGFATTICYWHPKTQPPLRVTEEYVAALDRLDEEIDCRVSLRPAGLTFDRGLFSSLHDRVRAVGRRLHLDATSLDLAEEAFGLIGSLTGPPSSAPLSRGVGGEASKTPIEWLTSGSPPASSKASIRISIIRASTRGEECSR